MTRDILGLDDEAVDALRAGGAFGAVGSPRGADNAGTEAAAR